MKKILSLMAGVLVSLTMLAGSNDLLWDYSEAKIPTTGPDNGLSYGAYVNDAPSTNNGLNGVKMNSEGYAYFTKAAVAGKLKLTYGPRSGSGSVALIVSTWSGETPSAQTKIVDTKAFTELGTDVIELTAEQNNIYISRNSSSAEGVLQKIQFIESVPRSFVDFKIEFRDNPYTVLLPEGGVLPTGVTVEGTTYNGGQHGIQGGTITVPVDGPVRFTIGACQHSNGVITVKKDGVDLTTISNKESCGEQKPNYNQNVPYVYTGEAGTLTFTLGEYVYCPYFFAEACDINPCEVIFKDQNGTELGRVETYEGALLEKIPYTEADLPSYPDAMSFRGWFYTNNKKAKAGDAINGNTTIQARVTPIEYVTVGSVQTYDFTSPTFYPEDHETVQVFNGVYHDPQHGWQFDSNGAIKIQVTSKAVVVVTVCTYSNNGKVVIRDAADNPLTSIDIVKESTPDGTDLVCQYTGAEGWLSVEWTSMQYIHKVVVYNVLDFPQKDTKTGYYIVPKNDVASFILALVQANGEGNAKIFLPNGTYDLGETTLTTISGNNISIIGQSMEGTIIKNAPPADQESIDKTATIKINKNVKGTYLQDLTIQNALDYYKNDNGRAVALWDQGTQTVCKNVRLLSYQDTYYSNLQGAVKYFEDCEIHGTVDFICGDGSVYFKNNLLYCEKRKKAGGGSDALTANNGIASDKGYVFEGCTVKSECPVVSFGRAWNNMPKCAFLNTTVSYSAGEFSFESSDIQRWTKKLMNQDAWPVFGEYNTVLADGTIITPASNKVTFIDEKSGNATKEIETVLTAEGAAQYTMANTLGEWAATAAADATQAVAEETAAEFEPEGVYMIEGDGEFKAIILGKEFMDRFAVYDGVTYKARKANARGGFGKTADESIATVESAVVNEKVSKIIRDGQVYLMYNGKMYNVQGKMMK